jgi:cell division protein FtsW (lipid II flippase)
VKKLFAIRDQQSEKDVIQSRLLIIAFLIMVCYALILTLAPSIRFSSDASLYEFKHWLGLLIWVVVFVSLHLQTSKKLTNRDPYLLPIIALLCGIGLMTIWRLYPNFGMRQSIWLAISGLLFFIALQFPSLVDILHRYKYIWLVLGLFLTALTIIWGTNPSNAGPELWFQIFGIYFQPSEPLKLLFIAFLSGYFSDRIPSANGKLRTILPTLVINGIAVLLLIFQRDLGTALVFLFLYFAMLYAAQGKKLVLWVSIVFFLISALAGYFFIDIVRLRIDTWLQPFADPSGASYQIIQSWIALAEGNVIGTGPGLGNPSLIPVAISDFIFSAIGEETGFLGATIIILLFVLLVFRGTKISRLSNNAFHRNLSMGLVFYFGIQSILIMGGNLGLLPLTGVTLPFVSYGGTSLLVSFSGLYLLLSVSNQINSGQKAENVKRSRFSALSTGLILLLVGELVATSVIAFWFRTPLVNRAENPRWIIDDRFTPRGNILDRNNLVIISNEGNAGDFQRTTSHIPLYPVIGYTSPIYGQTGIEASMYPYLRGYEGYPFKTIFWQDLLRNQPPKGLDIRLTLDLELQKQADNLLGDTPGTIVVMNANSGEILVMSSHPYFDAAQLAEQWENLVARDDAPLINRATQGVYTPGTTLFPFILTAGLEQNLILPDPNSIASIAESECALAINDELTWGTLVNHGCKEAQETLAELLGAETLADSFQNFGLFTEPELHLNVAMVEKPLIDEQDAFFQGTEPFNITPLQMALAASIITNNGTQPGPRIVNAYYSPEGVWETIPKLSSNNEILSSDIADEVRSIIQMPGRSYWQASALVQSENDNAISWWIAGTTSGWAGQPLTIVVLLESSDVSNAERIGETLLNASNR